MTMRFDWRKSTGEEIAVDIDAAGSGAKGLEVRLTFATP